MATAVKIVTPSPTTEQVARRLGISGDRRRTILKLAQDAVDGYYRREARTESSTPKKTKAA